MRGWDEQTQDQPRRRPIRVYGLLSLVCLTLVADLSVAAVHPGDSAGSFEITRFVADVPYGAPGSVRSPPSQVLRDHLLTSQCVDFSPLATRVGVTLCDDAVEALVAAQCIEDPIGIEQPRIGSPT
jgi:hypothetical protein